MRNSAEAGRFSSAWSRKGRAISLFLRTAFRCKQHYCTKSSGTNSHVRFSFSLQNSYWMTKAMSILLPPWDINYAFFNHTVIFQVNHTVRMLILFTTYELQLVVFQNLFIGCTYALVRVLLMLLGTSYFILTFWFLEFLATSYLLKPIASSHSNIALHAIITQRW